MTRAAGTAENGVSVKRASVLARLRRDTAGLNFWLNKLNSFGGNFIDAQMVEAFIESLEYRQRFGP
jgi:hypothetical protein